MEISTLLLLAIMLFAGLLLGRAVKMVKLPNVTGYLIAGLLIGPYCLKLVSPDTVRELELISEMALGFIAFLIGAEFKLSYLKKAGVMPLVIATVAALLAAVMVTGGLVLFGFSLEISLLLGAIASATAPAATVMVVKQYAAKGAVSETLLSVVAIDDAIALIIFGFSVASVNIMKGPGDSTVLMSIATPLIEIFGSIFAGFLLGYLYRIPLKYFKKGSNRSIISVAAIFLAAGLAELIGLSSLLLCMSMGAMLANVSNESEEVFRITDSMTPPIFLLFFVVSGMELDITILPQIGLIGILYILLRSAGKIAGSSLGAAVVKAPPMIKKYLGLTLLPQAGVAIGLSLVASRQLPEYGQTITTVVLCATFVYEIAGPAITKIALVKAGEIEEPHRIKIKKTKA